MNRCNECKHKDSCVCVPYGCECFEFDLAEHDKQIKAEVIDFIVDNIVFPLLDEYDIGFWKNIDYIPLAEKWVEAIQNNIHPSDEKIKAHLKKWIAEELKEKKK